MENSTKLSPQTVDRSFADYIIGGWVRTGPRLYILQRAWVILTILAVLLFIAGIPSRYDQLVQVATSNRQLLQDLGFGPALYAGYFITLDSVLVFTHILIAALIFLRRSDSKMAVLVAITLVTVPLAIVGALEVGGPPWDRVTSVILYIGLVASVSLLYLFPNGRFVPRWTKPLAIIWAVITVPAVFFEDSILSLASWPFAIQVLVLLFWGATGVFAQLHRYVRVSDPLQKQQTKWALLGLTAAVVGPFGHYLHLFTLPSLNSVNPPPIFYNLADPTVFQFATMLQIIGITLFTLAVLLFPISFGVAVLRHHLFEIEFIVNRTLVYSLLTAILVLIYAASVVLFERLFNSLTGESSPVAIAISTLVIAALFRPLRSRIQTVIDRRFYRRKYDAVQTLSSFAAKARDEVDLDQLATELLRVVDETMQPDRISIWLKPPTEL